MSERSKQRAREMAVIDAAVAWRANHMRWEPIEAEALIEAVDDYCNHGLARATGTPTRYTAPQTSHEAAEWLSARVHKPLGRIFAAVLASGGLTVDQLVQRLDLPHQTVSARVNQLRDQGYVVDSGHRRPTRSGREAIVWTVSVLARTAARQVPAWGWQPTACEREES